MFRATALFVAQIATIAALLLLLVQSPYLAVRLAAAVGVLIIGAGGNAARRHVRTSRVKS